MTTPTAPFTTEERVTILETRLEAVLPNLATKEDIAAVKADSARLEGKMDAMEERLNGKMDAMNAQLNGKMDAMEERLNGKMDAMEERLNGKMDSMNAQLNGKMDAMGNRLLIRFAAVLIPVAGIVIAAVKYL